MGQAGDDPDCDASDEPGQDTPEPEMSPRGRPTKAHQPGVLSQQSIGVDDENAGGQEGKNERPWTTDESRHLPREQEKYRQEQFWAGDDGFS